MLINVYLDYKLRLYTSDEGRNLLYIIRYYRHLVMHTQYLNPYDMFRLLDFMASFLKIICYQEYKIRLLRQSALEKLHRIESAKNLYGVIDSSYSFKDSEEDFEYLFEIKFNITSDREEALHTEIDNDAKSVIKRVKNEMSEKISYQHTQYILNILYSYPRSKKGLGEDKIYRLIDLMVTYIDTLGMELGCIEQYKDSPQYKRMTEFRKAKLMVLCNRIPNLFFEDNFINRELKQFLVNQRLFPLHSFQKKVIKSLLQGQNNMLVFDISGSGKTTAFIIGILEKVDRNISKYQILVIASNYEKSKNIVSTIEKLVHPQLEFDPDIDPEFGFMLKGLHVIVSTPERMIGLNKSSLDTSSINTFIIDEADHILSTVDGFKHIEDIRQKLPYEIKICLIGNNFDEEDYISASKLIPKAITISYNIHSLSKIKQQVIKCLEDDDGKYEELLSVLTNYDPEMVIVYCNTFERVESLFKKLQSMDNGQQFREKGFKVSYIHDNLGQIQISLSISEFNVGGRHILIRTDFMVRGIDLNQINLVINYDMPGELKEFRSRMMWSGIRAKVLNFVAQCDDNFLRALALRGYEFMEQLR